jgi:hypothetical protein
MPRCMICGKEHDEAQLSGRICRTCGESVRRDARSGKLHEKRDADRAIRSTGQTPPKDGREK